MFEFDALRSTILRGGPIAAFLQSGLDPVEWRIIALKLSAPIAVERVQPCQPVRTPYTRRDGAMFPERLAAGNSSKSYCLMAVASSDSDLARVDQNMMSSYKRCLTVSPWLQSNSS